MNPNVAVNISFGGRTYTAALYFTVFYFGRAVANTPVRSSALWIGPLCFSVNTAITSTQYGVD